MRLKSPPALLISAALVVAAGAAGAGPLDAAPPTPASPPCHGSPGTFEFCRCPEGFVFGFELRVLCDSTVVCFF